LSVRQILRFVLSRLKLCDSQDLGQWAIRYNASNHIFNASKTKHIYFTLTYAGEGAQKIDDTQDHDVLIRVWAIRSALSGRSFPWEQPYVLSFNETPVGKHSILLVNVRESPAMLSSEAASNLSTQTTGEISFSNPPPTRSATLPDFRGEFRKDLHDKVSQRLARRAHKPLECSGWGLSSDEEGSECEDEEPSLLSRSTL
jgi:hypothetical protein